MFTPVTGAIWLTLDPAINGTPCSIPSDWHSNSEWPSHGQDSPWIRMEQYTKLTKQITGDFKSVPNSTDALKEQIDSLAMDVLQNRRALALLTPQQKGDLSLLRGEVLRCQRVKNNQRKLLPVPDAS